MTDTVIGLDLIFSLPVELTVEIEEDASGLQLLTIKTDDPWAVRGLAEEMKRVADKVIAI